MPPRKTKTKQHKQVVLQLYNCKDDRLIALYIDEILVAYNGTIRVKLPGHSDPLFLLIDDEQIIYHGEHFSDFSVSTIDEAREGLAKTGHPITAFDPSQAWE